MRFTRWNQQATTETTNEIVKSLSLVHASRISDEAVRKRAIDLLDRGDLSGLCDLDPTYGCCSVYDAIQVRQINAFYKKRVDIELGVDRTAVARGKFMEAEELCRQTNHIIALSSEGKFNFLPGVDARILRAQRKIAEVLGDVPSLADLKLKFGPGATTQIPKRMASARRKLGQIPACSEELLPLVRDVLEELQSLIQVWASNPDTDKWFDLILDEGVRLGSLDHTDVLSCEAERREWIAEKDACQVPVEIHPGRLAFVPKTAKTDRPIVVEPWLNGICQIAVGEHIARRLRGYGVDIRDQTRNQSLARQGSLSGALATLDLSSASDTIAYNLVGMLLPVDWVIFLSHFRTGTVMDGDVAIRQEKFSSMGNGFTFPLETLIFYGLAWACVDDRDQRKWVSVYGDDIIVPTAAYPHLMKLLQALGFIPNPDKSFCDGPFRESCGADYLSGINIRPVYQKTALHAFDLFRLHNFYVEKLDEECAAMCLQYLDESLRKWGPAGYGDGHLVSPEWRDRVGVPFKRDHGWSGYTFETYRHKGRRDFEPLPGDYVLPFYSIYLKEDDDMERSRFQNRVISGELLHLHALTAQKAEEPAPVGAYRKNGAFGVSIPGVKGYESVKIYTLLP